MAVRTYNPSVRVGNWSEDLQLEEDTLKDFMARRERGELLIQQNAAMLGSASAPVSLSCSRDGGVHFGDVVQIVNPAPTKGSLSMFGGGAMSVSSSTAPSARNTFRITACDGTADGTALAYGQPFYIANEQGVLFSDRASFRSCAKKSRHNEVCLTQTPSHLTEWMVLAYDPKSRFELEGRPVPANSPVVVRHIKTNCNLCAEAEHVLKTPFGKECEVSTWTKLDSHKMDEPVNHWLLAMTQPGDGSMPGVGQ